MRQASRWGSFALAAVAMALVLAAPRLRAVDTLPDRIADEAFWKLIDDSSEPGGVFQSENFLSNETGFQSVIPALKQSTKPGAYLGVGPEQNFTYIAALRPRIVFIIDIRHQNMLEHLLYKALFELSDNRADFLSRLFSLKRPAGLTDKSTADDLFNAYRGVPTDEELAKKTLQEIKDRLLKKHGFKLAADDEAAVEHVHAIFQEFGPDINYNSGARRFGGGMPNYVDLMTATDLQGQQRSYLANEDNYRAVRDLEDRNLIVPVTGDFGGTKALRAVGQYLKAHNAIVSAFYLSNVERYLFQPNGLNQNGGWTAFYANVGMLPIDASSTFIRSMSGGAAGGFGGMRRPNVIASIQATLAAIKDGRIRYYDDVFLLSK